MSNPTQSEISNLHAFFGFGFETPNSPQQTMAALSSPPYKFPSDNTGRKNVPFNPISSFWGDESAAFGLEESAKVGFDEEESKDDLINMLLGSFDSSPLPQKFSPSTGKKNNIASPMSTAYPGHVNQTSFDPQVKQSASRTPIQAKPLPPKTSFGTRQGAPNIVSPMVQEDSTGFMTQSYMPQMNEMLKKMKLEQVIPLLQNVEAPQINLDITGFIRSEGFLNPQPYEDGTLKYAFHQKIATVLEWYRQQIVQLSQKCNEFVLRMTDLLYTQSMFRPVTDQELQLKVLGIRVRLDNLSLALKQNTCDIIRNLYQEYAEAQRKKVSAVWSPEPQTPPQPLWSPDELKELVDRGFSNQQIIAYVNDKKRSPSNSPAVPKREIRQKRN